MSEYNVNLMTNGRKTVFPCSQYTVTVVEENSPVVELGIENPHSPNKPYDPGIYLALGDKPENTRRIHLPTDGEAVFITNQQGKTIDSYRWPLTSPTNRKEIRQ